MAYLKAKGIKERKDRLKLCLECFVCPNCTSLNLELYIDKYLCPDCGWSQAITPVDGE